MLSTLNTLVLAAALSVTTTSASYAAEEIKSQTTQENTQRLHENKSAQKTDEAINSRKKNNETTNEANKTLEEMLKNDISTLKRKVETQDKIIEIQNTHFQNVLSILGIFLGILSITLTIGGIASYFSINKKAEREANLAANEWFERNANKLNAKIEELELKLKEIESTASEHFNAHTQRIEDEVDSAMKRIQESMTKQGTMINEEKPEKIKFYLNKQEERALEDAASSAASKPASEMDFADWNKRAFDAYLKSDKENALEYWRTALTKGTPNKHHRTQALLNIAITEQSIENHEEAIRACEEAIALNRGDESPKALSHTAQALLTKSASYYELGLPEKAQEINDELVSKFKNIHSKEIQKHIATSESNTTVYLGQIGKYEEAIEKAESLLEKIFLQNEEDKQDLKFRLNNTIAFSLICMAKRDWADEKARTSALIKARSHALEAVSGAPEKKIPQGNLIYCNYLIGSSLEHTCMEFEKILTPGDNKFYKATITDLETHPVEEKDPALKKELMAMWMQKNN